jgi:NhaP-type Na+/H+ and K+/H+ antiporter
VDHWVQSLCLGGLDSGKFWYVGQLFTVDHCGYLGFDQDDFFLDLDGLALAAGFLSAAGFFAALARGFGANSLTASTTGVVISTVLVGGTAAGVVLGSCEAPLNNFFNSPNITISL